MTLCNHQGERHVTDHCIVPCRVSATRRFTFDGKADDPAKIRLCALRTIELYGTLFV